MGTTRKGLTSFIAASTIASFLRVKYVSGNQCDLAGATDNEVGVSTGDKTSNAVGTPVPVQLTSEPGSVFLTAAGAITEGALVYRAASGKVAATGTELYGVALEAAGANNDVIEVLPNGAGQSKAFGATRSYTVLGHNGAGNITVTGLLVGDVILKLLGLTSGTLGDLSAGFTSPIATADTLVQTSATDYSAKVIYLEVAQP